MPRILLSFGFPQMLSLRWGAALAGLPSLGGIAMGEVTRPKSSAACLPMQS